MATTLVLYKTEEETELARSCWADAFTYISKGTGTDLGISKRDNDIYFLNSRVKVVSLPGLDMKLCGVLLKFPKEDLTAEEDILISCCKFK